MTDEKIRAMVAKARKQSKHLRKLELSGAELLDELADALEQLAGVQRDRDLTAAENKELLEENLRLSAFTVPDGDARERLIEVLRTITPRLHEPLWTNVLGDQADAILAAVPELSRDIAGEIEAEIERNEARAISDYLRGLRRAAEIVRNGR